MNDRTFAVTVLLLMVLTGCSWESVGERLTRECREIVDASTAPATYPNDPTLQELRKRIRADKIRECVWERGTKGDRR